MDSRVDVFVEPLSLLASELAEITARLQTLQDSHSARVETAAARLHESVREQVTVNLQQRLDCEFQEATRVIRMQFDERMRTATDAWALERQTFLNEIANLRSSFDRRELSTEVAHSEAALIEVRKKIDTMVDDPSVEMAKLIRLSAREAELQAYLKGLRFKAGVLNSLVAAAQGAPIDTTREPMAARAKGV